MWVGRYLILFTRRPRIPLTCAPPTSHPTTHEPSLVVVFFLFWLCVYNIICFFFVGVCVWFFSHHPNTLMGFFLFFFFWVFVFFVLFLLCGFFFLFVVVSFCRVCEAMMGSFVFVTHLFCLLLFVYSGGVVVKVS